MKILREIDLSQATELMEKVDTMQRELDMEKGRLTKLLVDLNLEYYGTSPGKYYNSIEKEYCTEDGFSVKIDSGTITIRKKITDKLNVTFKDRFYESSHFSAGRCEFVYDSGRHIQFSYQKQMIVEKYAEQFSRFEEILQNELIYDPFADFGNYISFTDFFKGV